MQFLDIKYLEQDLSSDAVPELIKLSKTNWPAEWIATSHATNSGVNHQNLINSLNYKKDLLGEKIKNNILSLSLSDLLAFEALKEINN